MGKNIYTLNFTTNCYSRIIQNNKYNTIFSYRIVFKDYIMNKIEYKRYDKKMVDRIDPSTFHIKSISIEFRVSLRDLNHMCILQYGHHTLYDHLGERVYRSYVEFYFITENQDSDTIVTFTDEISIFVDYHKKNLTALLHITENNKLLSLGTYLMYKASYCV